MTMQAGTYYVGDLCYVMHPEWNEVCELIIDKHSCKEGEFELVDGRRFAIYNTSYGDGQYSSNTPHKFCVDSGSIGCIRLEDITDETYSMELVSDLGAIITFESDFVTSVHNGTIRFGNVEIYTADMNEYKYEDEDEYGDDEEEEDY